MTKLNPLQVPRAILIISTILVMVYAASILLPRALPGPTRVVAAWLDLADTQQNVYAAGVEESGRFVTTRPIKPMPLFSRTTAKKDGKEVVEWEYLKVSDANGNQVDWVIPPNQEIKARNPKVPLFSAEGEQMFEVQMPDKYGLYTKSTATFYAPCRFTEICTNPSAGEKEKSDDKSDGSKPPASSAWDSVPVTAMSMSATGVFSTGINLKKGQQVRIRATGTVNSSGEATSTDGAYKWVGPDGWQSDPSFNAGRRGPLSAGQSFMALSGRITNGNPSTSDGNWNLVGSDRVLTAQEAGELKLVVNDKTADSKGARPDWPANNQGGFQLQIQVK